MSNVSDDVKDEQGKINNNKLKELAKSRKDFYEKAPFLTISEELLLALKDNLIEKLVIITNFRKGKKLGYRDPNKVDARKDKKFHSTFGKFPQCVFHPIGVSGLSSKKIDPRPYR